MSQKTKQLKIMQVLASVVILLLISPLIFPAIWNFDDSEYGVPEISIQKPGGKLIFPGQFPQGLILAFFELFIFTSFAGFIYCFEKRSSKFILFSTAPIRAPPFYIVKFIN